MSVIYIFLSRMKFILFHIVHSPSSSTFSLLGLLQFSLVLINIINTISSADLLSYYFPDSQVYVTTEICRYLLLKVQKFTTYLALFCFLDSFWSMITLVLLHLNHSSVAELTKIFSDKKGSLAHLAESHHTGHSASVLLRGLLSSLDLWLLAVVLDIFPV